VDPRIHRLIQIEKMNWHRRRIWRKLPLLMVMVLLQ
jgi:hypothetical protein